MPRPTFEPRGPAAPEAPGRHVFPTRPDADARASIGTLRWDTVSPAEGELVGGGPEFLVLDEDGRIRTDCRFIR